MFCPSCGSLTRVTSSNRSRRTKSVRRDRVCLNVRCGLAFATREVRIPSPHKTKHYREQKDTDFILLWTAGKTYNEICTALSIDWRTVSRWRTRLSLPPRKTNARSRKSALTPPIEADI